jgi:hypothetical protein
MSNRHAPLRRPLSILVLGACFALALGALGPACADDSARETGANIERPPRLVGPAVPDVEPEAEAPLPPTVDVAGRVVNDLEEAVIGRPIVLVDGRGKRQEVLTDEDGGFYVIGVVLPYDLVVAEAPSGAVITPIAFLGLNRTDPRLEVFETQGPVARPASQPVRIGVKLPPCRATAGACWVSVVSASPSGSGTTAGSYTAETETSIYDVDHTWREPTTRPGESIDVHVLVGDAQYTEYAYSRVTRVAARPGEPTDVGMTMPTPVESTDPVSVAGHATMLPEGWQWTLASQLELPGGAMIALRYDWTAATAMRLPRLAGATWHVGAWAQHPPAEGRPYFHRSAQAWSGTLPITLTNVALDVPMTPEPLRPLIEGTLSRRGQGIAWDARSPALASLVLVDLARGRQRFRAFTSESEIALKRLEALGLRRLDPGDHVFDLMTTPGATVDELTQPDEHQRARRFDVHVPGATTYQRFRFQVTE